MSPEEHAAANALADLLANRTHDVHGGMYLIVANAIFLRDENGLGRKFKVTVETVED
jgi:hypothetical protein